MARTHLSLQLHTPAGEIALKIKWLILILGITTSAFGNTPLNCAPAVARKIHSAMSAMRASTYAPGRYTFLRSTCGFAEHGLYCVGRDANERLQNPVHRIDARNYQEGIAECGVPRDSTGRWHTGEIRCRADAQATCRIFPPAKVPANWPQTGSPRVEVPPTNTQSDQNQLERQRRYDEQQRRYDDYIRRRGGPNQPEAGSDLPRELEVNETSGGTWEEQVESIRSAGVRIIDDAYARTGDRQTGQLKTKLASAKIKRGTVAICGAGADACVLNLGGNTFWLMPNFWANPDFGYKVFVMLHEAAHLIGIGNECAANRLSRKVIADAGANINVVSGYDAECGDQ